MSIPIEIPMWLLVVLVSGCAGGIIGGIVLTFWWAFEKDHPDNWY